MEQKIIDFSGIAAFSEQLHSARKKIILAGGCFDILHTGHIEFLKEAKKKGDILIILLESDKRITQLKGPKRPFNSQRDRASLLAAITVVDYVILLPYLSDNQSYDTVISQVKPAIIATTAGDPNRIHKERQCSHFGCTVVDVIGRIPDQSSTEVLKKIRIM